MALFCAKSGQLQTVKGVFECKEMLREGVDYEVYDWLETDNAKTNYIRIPNYVATSEVATIKYKKIGETIFLDREEYFFDNSTGFHFGSTCAVCIDKDGKFLICNHFQSIGHTWSGAAVWRYDLSVLNTHGDMTMQIKTKKNSQNRFVCDDVITFSDEYILAPRNTNWSYSKIETFNMKLSVPNGWALESFKIDDRMSLTPCQLLRNIPSTLDNNGKARQAGECGMYDSVSGKFFGNVASRGSFTVTND